MTKIEQCKGAADFLRIMWLKLYRPQCIETAKYHSAKNCFKEVHLHFSEMAEAYVNHSRLSSSILNRCFAKPVNRVLEEIALNYELEEEDTFQDYGGYSEWKYNDYWADPPEEIARKEEMERRRRREPRYLDTQDMDQFMDDDDFE